MLVFALSAESRKALCTITHEICLNLIGLLVVLKYVFLHQGNSLCRTSGFISEFKIVDSMHGIKTVKTYTHIIVGQCLVH